MAGTKNDVSVAKNADFSQVNAPNATSSEANGLVTNGKMWIGSTATNAGGTHINVGTLTSPDSTLTIGYSSPDITIIANGSSVGKTITGNTGAAQPPTSGNWNIVTANATPKFAGAASTLTLDFGLDNLLIGSSGTTITSGVSNVALGDTALNAVTSGGGNTCVGKGAGALLTTATNTVLIGYSSGGSITTASNCTGVGVSALASLTTGVNSRNTALGQGSLLLITTGADNIGIGVSAGVAYVSSESSNIVIGSDGVVTESHVIRIGTQGSGSRQQNQCYLAGVLNTVSGRVVNITTPGAYPYTALVTDYVILVDSSSARTINLIASPVTGTTYRIKDNTGSAGSNNITISGNGKNIDGATPYIISSNYDSVDVVYNGTQWNVL